MQPKSLDRHVFSIFLILFSLIVVMISLDFKSIARVFPLTFGTFTFILASLQLLSDLFPDSRILAFMRTQGLAGNLNFNSKEDEEEQKGTSSVIKADEKNEWFMVFKIFVWLLIFVIVIRYVTYFIVVPIFLLLFLKFLNKETWKTAILLAICAGAAVYLLFGLILGR